LFNAIIVLCYSLIIQYLIQKFCTISNK
jgi:hypothetical protein